MYNWEPCSATEWGYRDEHLAVDRGWESGMGNELAEFRDARVKASPETIAKSLEGTWRRNSWRFCKRQLADWDHVQQQIAGLRSGSSRR